MENISCSTIRINLFSSDSKQPGDCGMTFLAAYNEKSSRLHVFQLVKIISTFFVEAMASAPILNKPWYKVPYFFHVCTFFTTFVNMFT